MSVELSDETNIVGQTIMKPQAGRPSWKNRRKVVFATLLFCAFCIMFIMFQGNDTQVNQTIILGSFALAGSVIGAYVFGAAWTDISIEKIKSTSPLAQLQYQQGLQGNQPQQGDSPEPAIIDPLADGKGPDDD